MLEVPDAELLQRWRSGDRGAGEALMRRHYRTVLRFFELNASWAADDLTQRTFVASIERADQVRDAAAFRAYLLGIARRQLAMHLRELTRGESLHSFDAPELPGRATRLSTLVARNREQMLALRALASLPRRAQALLILFYWDGVKTPSLASAFGVPESTVRTRLGRARDLLRRRMTSFSTPSLPMAEPDDDQLRTLLAALAAPSDDRRGGHS
jgi:RNA polymerase sigma factor (sigma-70 family)